jgi:hypothetical protein
MDVGTTYRHRAQISSVRSNQTSSFTARRRRRSRCPRVRRIHAEEVLATAGLAMLAWCLSLARSEWTPPPPPPHTHTHTQHTPSSSNPSPFIFYLVSQLNSRSHGSNFARVSSHCPCSTTELNATFDDTPDTRHSARYTGFLFAKVASSGGGGSSSSTTASVTVTVSIENHVTGTVLASQQLVVPAVSTPGAYARLNFSLTPTASTDCHDIAPGDDPTVSCGKPISTIGHTCQVCGGEFVIALSDPGASVLVNYVMLEPGEWGRVPGLSVLASSAANLRSMGIKAIRQGGSYASAAPDSASYYDWQNWTGPAWTRPSRTNGVWRECLLAGWGPFEMIGESQPRPF